MGKHILATLGGIAIVTIFLTQIVLFGRVARLQEQMSSDRSPKPAASPAPAPQPAAPTPPESVPVQPAIPNPEPPARNPAPAPETPAPTVAPTDPVNAGQVEEIVRRMMEERERENHRNFRTAMEDPLSVMERELGLSPTQKAKIQDLIKARDKAFQEAFEAGGFNRAKGRELMDSYQAALKTELSTEQWEKYQQLRKDGKILDGASPQRFRRERADQ